MINLITSIIWLVGGYINILTYVRYGYKGLLVLGVAGLMAADVFIVKWARRRNEVDCS